MSVDFFFFNKELLYLVILGFFPKLSKDVRKWLQIDCDDKNGGKKLYSEKKKKMGKNLRLRLADTFHNIEL